MSLILSRLSLLLAACLALAGCTTRTPLPPSEPEPEPISVRLLFAGDLMQHLPQVEAARRDTAFDYAPVFEALRPRLAEADLAVVNLETTLTRTGPYAGYPCFRSPATLAAAMREAGFDVALTANNHCLDGGRAGVRTTAEELDRLGILRTGTFIDSADRAARTPLLVERRGVRFALLGYTYGTNGIPTPGGMLVNRIDTLLMAADLARTHALRPDCIVVCMHWGNEYERRENAAQRALARFLRRHGADLIIGGHPHVVQPYEADSSHVVLYSLGNFVSNQRRRYCDGGLVAQIEATKHPDGRMTYALEVVPVWVAMPGYRILPPEAADTMRLPEAFGRFRDDVAELLGERI